MPKFDSKTVEAGKHYYFGNCDYSNRGGFPPGMITFSVGIFQMVPKAGRTNQLKKTAAKVRVTGYCSHPEEVYKLADEICQQLDAGTYRGSNQRRA